MQNNENIKITICGDICPTKEILPLFENENIEELFHDVLDILKDSDLTIGNLEFPLSDSGIGIKKTGPVLRGKTKYIEIFKKTGFHLLNMANNHIRDCGNEGVRSSLSICNKYGIKTVGAGINKKEAAKPLILDVQDLKVGIMAFAEEEFNAATQEQAGANIFDAYESFDDISNFKKYVDYLIVLYHGGIEHYPYPSPLLQKKCRKMAVNGANLIVCQHSHCIGSMEEYNGSVIVYGQGNTLFGFRKNDPEWNKGLILNLNLHKDINLSNLNSNIDFIPIQTRGLGMQIVRNRESKKILDDFGKRSQQTLDQNFINESWNNFCEKKMPHYLSQLLGFGRYLVHLNRLSGNLLVKVIYKRKNLRTILNLNRCDSHHEVVITILKKIVNN